MANTMYDLGIRRQYVTSDGAVFSTRLGAINHIKCQIRQRRTRDREYQINRLHTEQNQILKENLERVFNDSNIINNIIQNKIILKDILKKIKKIRVY